MIVVGDVDSTMSCALAAAYNQIPVIHVEAGLRSFDRTMPEEINRLLTDAVSRWLFTTERAGEQNLLREGDTYQDWQAVHAGMGDVRERSGALLQVASKTKAGDRPSGGSRALADSDRTAAR